MSDRVKMYKIRPVGERVWFTTDSHTMTDCLDEREGETHEVECVYMTEEAVEDLSSETPEWW